MRSLQIHMAITSVTLDTTAKLHRRRASKSLPTMAPWLKHSSSSLSVRSIGTGCLTHQDSVIELDERQSSSKRPVGTYPSTDPTVFDERAALGGEPHKYSVEKEAAGVAHLWQGLSESQRAVLPDPAMLVRHLRAEDGNIVKAAAAIRAALEWRRAFGVDEIVQAVDTQSALYNMLRVENESGKIYVRGYDKEGRACMYMRPARENTHNELDNMRHLVWNMEKAIACTRRRSKELGHDPPLEKMNLLIDYAGFRLRDSPPLSTSKFTLDILQKHYPERMHCAYVLNAPFVFQTFWTLIRPFIDANTKRKIVFCSGPSGMDVLRRHMADVAKLEPAAGGKADMEFDSTTYMNLPFDVSFDE